MKCRLSKTQKLLKALYRLKVTKWRVSKELGVSWQTVHCWSRGVFRPRPGKLNALQTLLEHELRRKHSESTQCACGCGATFTPRHRRHVYASRACKNRQVQRDFRRRARFAIAFLNRKKRYAADSEKRARKRSR